MKNRGEAFSNKTFKDIQEDFKFIVTPDFHKKFRKTTVIIAFKMKNPRFAIFSEAAFSGGNHCFGITMQHLQR